jgi:hypothetical protein
LLNFGCKDGWNNPHNETTRDNYELLYDLETWLLDLLNHALARINAMFVQVYIRVANFHDSSVIYLFLWSYLKQIFVPCIVKLKEVYPCTLHIFPWTNWTLQWCFMPNDLVDWTCIKDSLFTFFWRQTLYICSVPLI